MLSIALSFIINHNIPCSPQIARIISINLSETFFYQVFIYDVSRYF